MKSLNVHPYLPLICSTKLLCSNNCLVVVMAHIVLKLFSMYFLTMNQDIPLYLRRSNIWAQVLFMPSTKNFDCAILLFSYGVSFFSKDCSQAIWQFTLFCSDSMWFSLALMSSSVFMSKGLVSLMMHWDLFL